jgi:hypothetical protein
VPIEFLDAAAAQRQDLPADPTRGRGAEEKRRIRNVASFTEATERRVLEHGALDLGR